MPRSESRFEVVRGQRLPLGGLNGYCGVRGKQGRRKDKFQGVTPKKQHRTALFDTALEAAIAFAQLNEDLNLGMIELVSEKKESPATTNATSKKTGVGTYLGYMRQLQWRCVPVVACAVISRQQAAAAVACGVAVAYADAVA